MTGAASQPGICDATCDTTRDANTALALLVESHWQDRLAADPMLCLSAGLPATRLPGGLMRDAQALAVRSQALVANADALETECLDGDAQVQLDMLRWSLRDAIAQPALLRHSFPLCGYLSPLTQLGMALDAMPLGDAAQAEAYADRMAGVPALFDEMTEHLRWQAAQGIVPPHRLLDQGTAFVAGWRDAPGAGCAPAAHRLQHLPASTVQVLQRRLDALADGHIRPALQRLLDWVVHDARPRAPLAVGIGQYPGGEASYHALMDRYVTLPGLDAQDIHATGLAALADCEARMATLRAQLGFDGDGRAFRDHLFTRPGTVAQSPHAMGAKLEGFGRLLGERVARLFGRSPVTEARVIRLDPALEPVLTFGYYDLPNTTRPYGVYFYNASKLDDKLTCDFAGLMAHEITPGHHFQAMLALESDKLAPLQKYLVHHGYLEGWAEYASQVLADELGAYDDPIDRYGRLTMEQAMAVRLVLDTGLNLLGWSFERAARFMHEHGIETADQIYSELLRYGTHMPAQALAYRLGMDHFVGLRAGAQRRLGARFDVRRFHDEIVAHGAVPLHALSLHVDRWLGREAPHVPHPQQVPPA